MGYLFFGMVFLFWFVLALVGAIVYSASPSTMALTLVLLIPGLLLVKKGIRRVNVFKLAGFEAIKSSRETGHVGINDIAGKTGTSPEEVLLVINTLIKKGIIPQDHVTP